MTTAVAAPATRRGRRGGRPPNPRKAEIIAALQSGKGPSQVAREMDIRVTTVWAYAKEARESRVVDLSPAPPAPDESVRQRILREIRRVGKVSVAYHLNQAAGTDQHNVVHVLYSLHKAGLVTFRESASGRQTELRDIELTKRGRQAIQPPRQNEKEEATDELTQVEAVVESANGSAPHEPLPDEESKRLLEPIYDPEKNRESITRAGVTPSLDRYPLIKTLLNRSSKLGAAANLLEEAGQTALAEMAREQAGKIEPLEEEVIRYVRETSWRPR